MFVAQRLLPLSNSTTEAVPGSEVPKILSTANSNDATDNMLLAFLGLNSSNQSILRVLPLSYERKLLPVLQLTDLGPGTGETVAEVLRDITPDTLRIIIERAGDIYQVMESFQKGVLDSASRGSSRVESHRVQWLQDYCPMTVIQKYDIRLRKGAATATSLKSATLIPHLLHYKLWVEQLKECHDQFLLDFNAKNAKHSQGGLSLYLFGAWIIDRAHEIQRLYMSARDVMLSRAHVLYMTNETALRSRFKRKFAHTLFDEAAFTRATTTLLLVSMTEGRCIMVGDEKQLPVVVKSTEADTARLGRSLFETIIVSAKNHSFDHVTIHSLKQQYRMDKSIGNSISKFAYNDTLITVSEQEGRALVVLPLAHMDAAHKRGRSFLTSSQRVHYTTVLGGKDYGPHLLKQLHQQDTGSEKNERLGTAEFKPKSSLNAGEAQTVRVGSVLQMC
jgi:hypothetical protein